MTSISNRCGSMLFCAQCSSLLNLPGDDDEIICDACGAIEDASATENQVITTRSHPDAFPSALREKKVSLVQHQDVEKKKVMVEQPCLKCGNPEQETFSLQMRSSDEGATTFYRCLKCSNQERVNN